MKIKMFQVDAFTEKLFGGNPAAICILDEWLTEDQMQYIAAENNLAETAFIVNNENGYSIRWFTPTIEVELCGHATLAAAHVIFTHLGHPKEELQFSTLYSGMLKVKRNGKLLVLDLPSDQLEKVYTPEVLVSGLGIQPMETYKGKTDYMAVLPSEEDVVNLRPDFHWLSKLQARGVIVTAMGNKTDFVSRFFAPQTGINEDPVTGSAHTSLVPYWAKEMNKNEFTALQLSHRKGHLWCKYLGNRVAISGHAVTYLDGYIHL